MGCCLIIAIDSSQMSGPYGDALFLTITNDANDSMLSLDFAIMSLENYEDWYWFLVNVKRIVGDKEVAIISNKHCALLQSVPEIIRVKNHAYCYRNLKENFSTFISRHNIRGNKGKEASLQWA